MRTNNFSSKKIAKTIAFVTLLAVCFVFVFAMTYSLASFGDGQQEVASAAATGMLGAANPFYGDGDNLTAVQFGFPGTSSSKTVLNAGQILSN